MPAKKGCKCNRHREGHVEFKPYMSAASMLTPEQLAEKKMKKMEQLKANTTTSTYTFTYTGNPFGGNNNGGTF